MSLAFLTHFILGVIASFIGTIPFGPINLTVVDTTLKQGIRDALVISVAAALVEIIQSFFALHCGRYVTMALDKYSVVQVIFFIAFIGIGILFFMRKGEKDVSEKKSKLKVSNFTKGLLVGLLNPQAIPFWVFVFTYYQMSHWIDFSWLHIVALLLGVSVGKFLALAAYGWLSTMVAQRIKTLSAAMNKIIGSIFIVIGLVQAFKYFW